MKFRRSTPLARNVARIDRFDARVDRLAETLTLGRIMVIRDAAYLNWRYADCPTVQYGRYAAGTEAAVSGCVVFHTYEADGTVRGIVEELVCSPDDPDTVVGLLPAPLCGPRCRRGGERELLASGLAPARDQAEGARVPGARSPQLLDRRSEPSPRASDSENLTEDRSWYYTHGDSDYHMRSA